MGLFRPYEQGSSTESAERPQPAETGTQRRGRLVKAPAPTRREGSGSATEQAPAPRRLGRLRRAERPAEPAAEPEVELVETDAAPRQPRKKNAPTPTRAQAEAARIARLHPQLTPKEAKKADRIAAREQRMRNLDAVENSPERRLARDHVDARLTITEFTIPLMLVIMAVSLAGTGSYTIQTITSLVMAGLFLLWMLNIFMVWRGYRKLLDQRGLMRPRGILMYLINRMMTIRALRRPEPRIRRGESY